MIESTSRFKVEQIVYNKGGFAIALGKWDGAEEIRAACRWHEADGIGYPQTFGKPQWMALPDDVRVDAADMTRPGAVTVTFA